MLIIDHCNKCQNIRLISEGSHDMKTGVMMLKIQIWHYRIKLHFYLALSIITKDNDKKNNKNCATTETETFNHAISSETILKRGFKCKIPNLSFKYYHGCPVKINNHTESSTGRAAGVDWLEKSSSATFSRQKGHLFGL